MYSKRNPQIYFLILLITCVLCGCNKDGCIENSGETVTLERPLVSIGQLVVYDNINVFLRQDSIPSLFIEAGENVIPYIKTEMKEHALFVSNTAKCKWLKDPNQNINIYISVIKLNKIDYHSSGNITSVNTLKTDYFTIESDVGAGYVRLDLENIQTIALLHNESADYIFKGKTDTCYTYCNSRGTIDFRDFEVKKMKIDYGSVRKGYINVTESLEGIIFHTGNLYYYGNPPTINMNNTNKGELIKL